VRVTPVLVDSNVLIDVATRDARWFEWSASTLRRLANETTLVINQMIYAEVSIAFARIEELEAALPIALFRRENVPYEAAFLAGCVFRRIRPPIPIESVHLFRLNSSTHSGRIRPGVSVS
jgi:hypothetical protein